MSADNAEKRVGRVAWHICGTRTMQFNCRVWAWTWHHAILECLLVLQREGWTPDTVGGKLTGKSLKLPDPLYSLDPFQVSLGNAPRLQIKLARRAREDRIEHHKLPCFKEWFIGDMLVSRLLVCPWHKIPGVELEFEIARKPMPATEEDQDGEPATKKEQQDGEHFFAVAGSSSSAVAVKRSRSPTPTTTFDADDFDSRRRSHIARSKQQQSHALATAGWVSVSKQHQSRAP